MKIFLIIACAAVALNLSSAEFRRPDDVLIKLEEYKAKSIALLAKKTSDYQAVQSKFATEILQPNFKSLTDDVIFETIRSVNTAHLELLQVLSSELPNSPACIANLESIVNSTKNFYGYSIANCLQSRNFEERGTEIVNRAASKVSPVPLPKAFISRNVYTSEDQVDIIDRMGEIYNEAELDGENAITEINQELDVLDADWKDAIAQLRDGCMAQVKTNIQNEFSNAAEKITSCQKFASRPAK